MRTNTIRSALAFLAFLAALQWSHPAAAEVPVTGTVGELGVINSFNGVYYFRFKMTDPNQTKTCAGTLPNNAQAPLAYAWFTTGDIFYREWYAALLVSKKGATITCTVFDGTTCRVTGCTLM